MEKRLHRKTEGQMICGVCSGIADYLQVDVTVVRLFMVAASCIGGIGLLPYIAAAVIMPVE